MKTIIKSIVLAAALMFSGPIVHMAKADHAPLPATCAVKDSDFLASAKNMNAKIRQANDKARIAIMDKINTARAQAGMWALEADIFMIGILQDKGKLLVGVVMFKEHCVVPGTVKVFAAEEFIVFITELGLSMDDFEPTQGV